MQPLETLISAGLRCGAVIPWRVARGNRFGQSRGECECEPCRIGSVRGPPWQNFEERGTVFGDKWDVISENSIESKGGFAGRFLSLANTGSRLNQLM
jgi:hypothetical protein